MPVEIPSPIPFEHDTVHHLLRSGARQPVLAHLVRSTACSPVAADSSGRAARCISSGAPSISPSHGFPGARAAARGPCVDARGLFPRGDQPRILARERPHPRAGVLRVCRPGTRGPEDRAGASRRAYYHRSSTSSSSRMRPFARQPRPTTRSPPSCRAPTSERRRWAGGIGRPWNGPFEFVNFQLQVPSSNALPTPKFQSSCGLRSSSSNLWPLGAPLGVGSWKCLGIWDLELGS